MKILYALAFATMPVAASATTITLSGADLVAARSTDGFNLIYAIDLSQLGFVEVNSVTVRDDANNNNAAGGRRSGFDLDLLAIGDEIDNVFTGDSVTFNAGGVAAGTELRGTTGEAPNLNTGVDEAFASLDALDGQLGPVSGFVSLGRQGELTSTFSRSYFVSDSDLVGELQIAGGSLGFAESASPYSATSSASPAFFFFFFFLPLPPFLLPFSLLNLFIFF